jgi:hypothetical protein
MKFSQRVGITPIKSIIQIESIDDDLRNSLWNLITRHYLELLDYSKDHGWVSNSDYKFIARNIWQDFYKEPIDTMPQDVKEMISFARKNFYSYEWYEVYDFIEYLPNINVESLSTPYETLPRMVYKEKSYSFVVLCNEILEKEVSGYRFIEKTIVPISDKLEIETIEKALSDSSEYSKLSGVRKHLETATNFLSDRKMPDYRNSIKESISAIESICQIISGDKKAELGKTLKSLSTSINLHGSLKEGFTKIYGYTSDGDGIRHALLEESSLDFEDAKYMLVACCGFVNYLIVKASKANISLK